MSYTSPLLFFNSTPITTQSAADLSSESVTLLNLSSAGDGLGGTFVWNGASTATADSVDVFQPTSVSGAGRWVRVSGQATYNATYSGGGVMRYATLSIPKATIIGTSAGQLGHANGVPIVAALGASYALEFMSGVVVLNFNTAAYTGGGTGLTFNYEAGGGALSAAVTAANSVAGSANKYALVGAAVPTNNQLVPNKGINLVAQAAPTDPGTAAGTLVVKLAYRVHTIA